ncbi:MAG: hypothetical protein BroJett030_33490 [Alphaproteobacteria bacterium]|nr:MAG: hypothetical protein BroJett030_33490 [Alphaproteobacteria bacterium]
MARLALLQKTDLSELDDPRLFREFAYVDGAWTAGSAGRAIDVTDPADGKRVGAVPALSAGDTHAAIAAAQRAFGRWAAMAPQERAKLLRRWFEGIAAARDDLARLMVREQGKPLSEAIGEIDYAASFVEFYAEEARRLNVESVTSHLPDADMAVMRRPVGVAALVTPWNFPSAMLTRKVAAALAAGCTVVAHPSSETPFSALALAELAERAGFPAGAFNVVTGHAPEVVGAMTASPLVRALSFTGSTEVGRLIYRQCAPTIKRLVMELGGHAPFIAFADCDFGRAVEQAIPAKFATSGQDCLAANRFLIERPLYERFVAAFAAFDREEDALEEANRTETGLVAYLHTRDAGRIARLSRALEFGMVAVNRTSITGAPVPFGGVKQAGLGREGSRHGMEAFTDLKYVCRQAG